MVASGGRLQPWVMLLEQRLGEHARHLASTTHQGRQLPAFVIARMAWHAVDDYFYFTAEFRDSPDVRWRLAACEAELSPTPTPLDIEMHARSAWSRLVEDHLLELETGHLRATYQEELRTMANPIRLGYLRGAIEIRTQHFWQYHRPEPPPSSPMLEMYRQAAIDMFSQSNVFLQNIDKIYVDPEAEARGLALLRAWLSAEQLAQYDKDDLFVVVGSDTRKHYRIKHGRQMNIEELEEVAGFERRACGWCFLPEGGLVAGDVMLGQKIALECFELEALKKANRFP